MKIGHLWYVAPLFGGAESWALGLSKALKRLALILKLSVGGQTVSRIVETFSGFWGATFLLIQTSLTR